MAMLNHAIRQVQSASLYLAVAVFMLTLPASAADTLIKVDWTNPELVAFGQQETASARRSLGPQADDKLAKLKLPVIAFTKTPEVVEKTFRIGPKPVTERQVVVDDENPVWYQITEDFGDVSVSVEADLRVQHKFPSSFPVYPTEPPGAAPSAGPSVSVFDERNEDGTEGIIAEYTVTKYGVPYTITIECSAEAKVQCQDTSKIAKDSDLLGLVRANVPGATP